MNKRILCFVFIAVMSLFLTGCAIVGSPVLNNIIALDEEDYSYAMVTGKNYNFLWILSRTPQIDAAIYDMLVQQAENWDYDISKLEVTPQICNN